MAIDGNELTERIHKLETEQATQAAATGGAQAAQAATQAGMAATMVVGSVSLIIGIFLGLTIKSKS